MNYIIAIVGASGSGKTTISRAMAEAGIPDIVSYTTRPMRPGETQGVEHIFITHEEAIALIETHEIAAYTEFGGYIYFTTSDQILSHQYCTYVVDETGLLMLQSNFEERAEVIPVFVERSEIGADVTDERRQRDDGRQWLGSGHYDIIVSNDAEDLTRLREWSQRFALAILSVLPVRGRLHRCRLHTSDTRLPTIINKLNNVKSAL